MVMNKQYIIEPERKLPILGEYEVCVVGGGCTGTLAAIRASRLGVKTALIEEGGCLGGTCTKGYISSWHQERDVDFNQQILAGITFEIIDRLTKRNAVIFRKRDPTQSRMRQISSYIINTAELQIELDEMVAEAGVILHFHTLYCAPYIENGALRGIIVETVSGRGVILGNIFIDATGDGDLCVSLGEKTHEVQRKQPATTCAMVYGYYNIPYAENIICNHMSEYNLYSSGWNTPMPNNPSGTIWGKSNVSLNLANAQELTQAEIECRRQNRALMDLLRKYGDNGDRISLSSLSMGVAARETRQITCMYTLSKEDVMYGAHFYDAVANGSYPVDIHYPDKPGATYYYLNGICEREIYNRSFEQTRWLPEGAQYNTYWQIPLRSMIPASGRYGNVIVCGRAIDADPHAFAAIRTIVTLNQTGEAAGVVAAMAVHNGNSIIDTDIAQMRELLKKGGAIVL